MISLNKVVTGYLLGAWHTAPREPDDLSEVFTDYPLLYFGNTMLRESAQEILLISSFEHMSFVKDLSPILAQRIRFVDSEHKLFRKVARLLLPVAREVGVEALVDKTHKRRFMDKTEMGWLMAMDYLLRNVYVFVVACRNCAEADVDIDFLHDFLTWVAKRATSSRCREVLNALSGIFGLYTHYLNIAGGILKVSTPCAEAWSRMDRLLNENEAVALAESRHLFGIPSKLADAALWFNKAARSFLSNRKHAQILRGVRYGLNVVKELSGISVPELPEVGRLKTEIYSPPIVNLAKIRPGCRMLDHRSRRMLFVQEQTPGWEFFFRNSHTIFTLSETPGLDLSTFYFTKNGITLLREVKDRD